MRNKALLIAATAAVAVGAPASALGGDAHIAAGHTVVLKNESFKPATLRIHRGDSVTWKWEDGGTEHNVTSSHFHSSSTRTKGTYTVRFSRAGTYNYHCTIHADMKGKIIVH
jgi:plastocyanin